MKLREAHILTKLYMPDPVDWRPTQWGSTSATLCVLQHLPNQ